MFSLIVTWILTWPFSKLRLISLMSGITLAQKIIKIQNLYFDHFWTDVIERSKQSLNWSEANIKLIDHMTSQVTCLAPILFIFLHWVLTSSLARFVSFPEIQFALFKQKFQPLYHHHQQPIYSHLYLNFTQGTIELEEVWQL